MNAIDPIYCIQLLVKKLNFLPILFSYISYPPHAICKHHVALAEAEIGSLQEKEVIIPLYHELGEFRAKLRWPEGTASRTLHTYGEAKVTHELIFSWLSWLAVLLEGSYARRQRGRRSRETWRPST